MNQALPQIRELIDEHLGIESHRHKEGRNTTLDRNEEDIGNLQTDEECERHDNGRESVALVVSWRSKGEVEVGEEGAEVGYEDGTHG